MGIISLLAAMLLPVLHGARQEAKKASCMSNQRQLLLATLYYCSDFGDYIPTLEAWRLTEIQNAAAVPGKYEVWNQGKLFSLGYAGSKVPALLLCPGYKWGGRDYFKKFMTQVKAGVEIQEGVTNYVYAYSPILYNAAADVPADPEHFPHSHKSTDTSYFRERPVIFADIMTAGPSGDYAHAGEWGFCHDWQGLNMGTIQGSVHWKMMYKVLLAIDHPEYPGWGSYNIDNIWRFWDYTAAILAK